MAALYWLVLFVSACEIIHAYRVVRNGTGLYLQGEPFRRAGANIFWLGLGQNIYEGIQYPTKYRIKDALQTAAAMGIGVVRSHTLGISVGNALSFEPNLDSFNIDALDTVDYSVALAEKLGIRLVVPLVDNWHFYHGGKWVFCAWRNKSEDVFFTDQQVRGDFKHYIRTLLSHTNRYSGKVYGNDSTVLAFETGNEIVPPPEWTADITAFIKSIAPGALTVDGTDGVHGPPIDTVDIMSKHFYPMNTTALLVAMETAMGLGKAFMAGEFGWSEPGPGHYDTIYGFLEAALNGSMPPLADRQSTDGSSQPALFAANFWSLFPHRDTRGFVQHGRSGKKHRLTMHFPGDSEEMEDGIRAIRAFGYRMRGQLPPGPRSWPAVTEAPLITQLNESGLAWRGSTLAWNYTVQRSSGGAAGPWTTVCDQCATDNDDPIPLPPGSKPGDAFRVAGGDGWHHLGPWSDVAEWSKPVR